MGITRLVASWVAVHRTTSKPAHNQIDQWKRVKITPIRETESRLNRRVRWIDDVAQYKVPFRFEREKGAQL